MNIWANAVVTKKGLALQAKLIEGATLTITRAVTGTGTVDASTLQVQTAVSGEKQTMTFRPVSYPEAGKCSVPVYLTNDALTTGYTIMQIGIYANDPDEGEILYFLCQAESGTGTPVPSVYENPGFSAEWNFTFQYGLADNVNVTVDPANTVNATQARQMIETALKALSPRDIGALAEEAMYYSSAYEVDIDTATHSLMLVDKKWSKNCPLCKDNGFVFIMQLFFGDPTASTSRTQIAFSYGDGGSGVAKGMALRCYFGGAWSPWSELYGPHNKPTPDGIGALPVYKSLEEIGLTTGTETIATISSKLPNNAVLYLDVSGANANIYPNNDKNGFLVVEKKRDNRVLFKYSYSEEGALRLFHGTYVLAYTTWTGWTEAMTSDFSNAGGTLPVAKGGTGTSGWHQALTNLKAMSRLATYYQTTLNPDIDTLTDALMLIPHEHSKNCPVGGSFVYIMQVFYGDTTASSNRTQIAFPYLLDGTRGTGMATRSYYNETWSEWDELASTADHRIKTYTSLAEIGVTAGSETIEAIAQAMGLKSQLVCATGAGNAAIYPDLYGMLEVTCVDSSRVKFRWSSKSINIEYEGIYSDSNTNKWSGWKKVYNEAYPPTSAEVGAAAASHTHGAAQITSGVFSATNIKAKTGTDYTYERLRNASLNAAETTPTENGAIAWTYE